MRGIALGNVMWHKVLTKHPLTGTRFFDFSNDAGFVITDRAYQCLGKATHLHIWIGISLESLF